MKIDTRLPRLLALAATLACAASMAAPLADAEKPASGATTLQLTSVRLAGLRTLAGPTDTGGSIEFGPGCVAGAPGESHEGVRQRVAADLPRAFQRELVSARLGSARYAAVAGDLEVNAFVNDVTARVCHTDDGAWRGRFYVQVSWQVAQRRTGQTVYQASTTGFFDHMEASAATSAAAGLREAFAMSIRNLLTDQRLAAVLQPAETDDETLASALPY